jgi:hypothetical protein
MHGLLASVLHAIGEDVIVPEHTMSQASFPMPKGEFVKALQDY